MRKELLFAVAATALFAASVPGLAMGGGGGGGYGGGLPMSTGATFDDYATALRLIHHERYADAIPHLEAALVARPHSADILNYLGYTHRLVGQGMSDSARDAEFKVSLDYYQRALTIDPDHKGVHEYLGELYLQMHDMASAQNELQKLATLCPSGCDERDTLGKALAAYVPPPSAAQPVTATQ